jgi:hypothetical protein
MGPAFPRRPAGEEHYRTVHLTKKVRESIWADVHRDADERSAIVQKDIERHQRRIEKLEANQARVVQLSYQGLVSDEVLSSEQHRLEAQKLQAERMLTTAELQAEDIESALDGALAKTKTPRAVYLASNPLERRLLNQAFFTRILIGEDSEVLGASLTPVYAALATWWEPTLGTPAPQKARKAPTAASEEAESANPDPVFRGQGSHVKPMVGEFSITSQSRMPSFAGRVCTRAQRLTYMAAHARVGSSLASLGGRRL